MNNYQIKSEEGSKDSNPSDSLSSPPSPAVPEKSPLRRSKTALGQIKHTPPPSPFEKNKPASGSAAKDSSQSSPEKNNKGKERLDPFPSESKGNDNRRNSIFLSLSIDSKMALPDKLVITKQKISDINAAGNNKSLLEREIRAGDHLRGIDINELLVEEGDDITNSEVSSRASTSDGMYSCRHHPRICGLTFHVWEIQAAHWIY